MEQTHTSSQPRTSATPLDPRLYQILSLSALLSYGFGWLHFDVSCEQIVVTIGTALLAQYTATRLVGLPHSIPRVRSSPDSRSACSSAHERASRVGGGGAPWRYPASSSFTGATSISLTRPTSRWPSPWQPAWGGSPGPVGPDRLVRLSRGLPRRPGGDSCRASRCDADISSAPMSACWSDAASGSAIP